MAVLSQSWKEIAAQKQAERQSRIPAEWIIPEHLLPSDNELNVQDFPYTSGFFTEHELSITDSTATVAVAKMASGEWSALEVAKAVCKRTAVAQQLINCVTEICFESAFKRATDLDEYLKSNGKVVGPLHGLPISLKDQFNLEGVDTTIGYAARAGRIISKEEESTLVKLLRDAGANFYVKSNVPITLMAGETVNNLFGRTLNPRNRDLTTGGSSGGESALVTFGASFMGVGTDIGGSVRHPAAYTGLFSLRPSHGRISYQQVANTFLGQEGVRSCAGLMSRSSADLRLFMSSITAQKPWLHDPQIVPIPWRTEGEIVPRKLCFGFGMGDGFVSPSPPLRRAMEITKAKLIQAGHSVIDYVPYELKKASEIVVKMWQSDGGEEVERDRSASGEPFPATVDSFLGKGNPDLKPSTVLETWQNQHQKALLGQRWLERWQKTVDSTGTGRPIDGLIMPSTVLPALRHNTPYVWHYGCLSPLLDLTTGTFPVTRVDLDKDRVPEDWQAISDMDTKMMDTYGRPENHANSLVGLALIAQRFEEEKVIAMLGVIEDIVDVDY